MEGWRESIAIVTTASVRMGLESLEEDMVVGVGVMEEPVDIINRVFNHSTSYTYLFAYTYIFMKSVPKKWVP